jgi:hypothetical protein
MNQSSRLELAPNLVIHPPPIDRKKGRKMKINELKTQIPDKRLPYEKPVLILINHTSPTDGKTHSDPRTHPPRQGRLPQDPVSTPRTFRLLSWIGNCDSCLTPNINQPDRTNALLFTQPSMPNALTTYTFSGNSLF